MSIVCTSKWDEKVTSDKLTIEFKLEFSKPKRSTGFLSTEFVNDVREKALDPALSGI